jgi:hypothetical protein
MDRPALAPFSSKALAIAEGTIFEHYKGNRYKFISLAHHSETLEEMVVYQALYGDYGIWVRPLSLFFGEMTIDGQTRPRFKQIT